VPPRPLGLRQLGPLGRELLEMPPGSLEMPPGPLGLGARRLGARRLGARRLGPLLMP